MVIGSATLGGEGVCQRGRPRAIRVGVVSYVPYQGEDEEPFNADEPMLVL